MNEKSLTTSFGDSIINVIGDPISDTAEIVLDSFLDDSVLRDIPMIKYAASVYKIVDDVKGRFYLNKLKKFIDGFNKGIASQADIDKYKRSFVENNQEKELAYILVIVDKYLDLKKPEILANLYLAYLDAQISWDEFCAYSETLDKILMLDLRYLMQNDSYTINTSTNCIPAELLRLTGVGLMYSYQNDSPFESDGRGGIAVFASGMSRVNNKERNYNITTFGQKLKGIIARDYNV